MSDTLRIASTSPMPLHMEFRDNNGNINKTIVINPAGAEAGFPEGLTEGVDADLYRQWVKANPDHAFVAGGIMREVPEDAPVTEYGFQVALDKAAEDADNTDLAEEGSTITNEAPVSAEDMAAHSDTPNDDSPRSAVNTGLETPAIAPVATTEQGKSVEQPVPAAPAAPIVADETK